MGQRLAIIFYDDSGKRFLTSYYHWSAYTSSMLAEVNRLIRKYTPEKILHDIRQHYEVRQILERAVNGD